jgi:hypothetical protein
MSTDYSLAYGTHATPEDGRCAMEWVSFLAGEPHSDDPSSVSPVLRAYCTTLNDTLEDGPRQVLRPYLARTIGTAGDGLDGERSWMAVDWMIRTYAPRWLATAGLPAAAQRVAQLREVGDSSTLRPAVEALREARRDTRAAWGAARPVAWTPWAAGRAAAREAAWSSGGAAAWAAARVAVGDMAGDRARALARDLAGDCAATIARATRTTTGRAAAREAARLALAPTLSVLQRSALQLLDRMLPTVALQTPFVDGRIDSEASVRGGSEVPV